MWKGEKMGYTKLKNGQAPNLSATVLNEMQKELLELAFPIRKHLCYTNRYKSSNDIEVRNMGKT